MQQWEDWGAGQYWRLLSEKALLTLLVTLLSYWLWQLWTKSYAESAVKFRVDLPSQLRSSWANSKGESAEQTVQSPADEVGNTSPSATSWLTTY